MLTHFSFNIRPERTFAIRTQNLEIHCRSEWRHKRGTISLLKYICVGSPTPSRWVTFYPRTVFFSPSASAEEIPQEFVNHFRGGFLHDVSQRTRPFPSSSILPRTVPVELGRRRSESRPSVSTVRDFYTSRPTRGDSARFLRIYEFEGSSVRDGRFDASRHCFLFSRKLAVTPTRVRRKITRIITILWFVAVRITHFTTHLTYYLIYIIFK